MQQIILGYDVREMWYEDQYDLIRRGRFSKLLSIDGSLWGSVFNQGDYPSLQDDERERLGLGTVELPEMLLVGMNRPLWSSLAEMTAYLRGCRLESKRAYWIVAITICCRDPNRLLRLRKEWPYYAETVPDTIQDGWVCVGYDVTSRQAESMILARLGASLERGVTGGFGEDLNEYLLFSEVRSAHEFRRAQDVENEGESPHLIYGIWRAEELLL